MLGVVVAASSEPFDSSRVEERLREGDAAGSADVERARPDGLPHVRRRGAPAAAELREQLHTADRAPDAAQPDLPRLPQQRPSGGHPISFCSSCPLTPRRALLDLTASLSCGSSSSGRTTSPRSPGWNRFQCSTFSTCIPTISRESVRRPVCSPVSLRVT